MALGKSPEVSVSAGLLGPGTSSNDQAHTRPRVRNSQSLPDPLVSATVRTDGDGDLNQSLLYVKGQTPYILYAS